MLDKKHEHADSNNLQKKQVESWVKNGPDNTAIEEAQKFGEYIAKTLKKVQVAPAKSVDESVTTSQIRQVFSKMKIIEAKGGIREQKQQIDFLMLKPFLAYATGRHKKTGLERLKQRLTWAIDAVFDGDKEAESFRFNNFCKLFEAILAYHRAHGGK
jgi:CRISPR-associated protein Csm2